MATLLGNYSDNEEGDFIQPEDSDGDNEKQHSRLLDAASAFSGKKRPQPTRTILGQDVSEAAFKTSSSNSHKIYSAMLGSISASGSHGTLKKQLKSVLKDAKAVSTPAPKHIQKQVQRMVLYEGTKKEISKWDPVVSDIRKAPQLKFPMQQPTERLVNSHMKFRPVTKLEKAFAAQLAKKGSEDRLPKGKLLTPNEEKEIAAMSMEEAQAKRQELVRKRQLIYEQTSKLRWQNKIKSKRYRRAKKKEKEKQLERELETLAVTDPQALLDRMDETEIKRIQERGRLRHRQGGKFAKQARIFAKYDTDKRQQIQDMVAKHKELTKKQQLPSSSDDDSGDDDNFAAMAMADTPNTWMKPSNVAVVPKPAPTQSEWDENQEEDVSKDNVGDDDDEEIDSDEAGDIDGDIFVRDADKDGVDADKDNDDDVADNDDDIADKDNEDYGVTVEEVTAPATEARKQKAEESADSKRVASKRTKAAMEADDDATFHTQNSARKKKKRKADKIETDDTTTTTPAPKKVDKSQQDMLMTMMEAFDDDDVVEEFLEEKRQKVDEETEKDQDLFLPGWGGWAGPGIVPNKKLRERFIKKAKVTPRADNHIGHCIISEKPNRGIEKHLLTRLPIGFKNEEHMKTILSKPLGREFNTEESFKHKVAPKVVVTRAGQILEPISDDVLLKKMEKKPVETDIDLENKSKSRKHRHNKAHSGKKTGKKRGKSGKK